VRNEADLPVAKREQLMKLLEEKGWKIDWEKKKIIEGPLRKVDVSFPAHQCSPPVQGG